MFYEMVRVLPISREDIGVINRGGYLETPKGFIRKSKPDGRGFRAYVLYDNVRDCRYRVGRRSIHIEYGEGGDYRSLTVQNPSKIKGSLVFNSVEDKEACEMFMSFLSELTEEYLKGRSTMAKIVDFVRGPGSKIFIIAGIIYFLTTVTVMWLG